MTPLRRVMGNGTVRHVPRHECTCHADMSIHCARPTVVGRW
jgi:hypothetical protein